MKQPLDAHYLINELHLRTGLLLEGFAGQDSEGHEYVEFRPVGIHQNDSFVVRFTLGWRNLIAEFEPGPYASDLLQQMASATNQKQESFSNIVRNIIHDGATYEMDINDTKVDPLISKTWPKEWNKLSLRLIKSPLAVNTDDRKQDYVHLLRWGRFFLSAILALSPIESEALLPVNPEGMPEGTKTIIEVNKYERNLQNRAQCIAEHGAKCSVCGFDFGKHYGDLGEGFIEVHHVVPVSQLGNNYLINPTKDLIPLCANCHAMVHKKKPPLTVEELRKIIGTLSHESE